MLWRFQNKKTSNCVVKCVYDLVLLAKEEAVLRSVTERLTETGKYYRMTKNIENSKVIRISW